MLYKIDNKYYVRVGKDFTEVELVFKDNDVDLKPTNNILEDNGTIKFDTINFLAEKPNILKNHQEEKPSRRTDDLSNKDNKNRNKTFGNKMFR